MIKVLGLGDNVVDIYSHTKIMYPGGNALNFAAYARMFGVEASYIGVFGDDEAALHVYQTAQEMNIGLSHCRYAKGENGYSRVELEDGDRVFVGSNKGGISKEFPLNLTALDGAYIQQYDIVHTSIFSFIEEELPMIRKYGKFVSMDFSNRATEEYFKQCAPYIDCASVSCSEMADEDIVKMMERIVSYGCKHVVIATRGSRGALVMVDGKLYEQSPCLIVAKDTMGAGDSFITSFLINYIDGMKDSVDFSPESGTYGVVTKEVYKNMLVQTSLYKAAIFSSQTCGCDGAFGFGKTTQL